MTPTQHRSLALSLAALLTGLAGVSPVRAQLSFSQSSVFTNGLKGAGSEVSMQTFSGATATFAYSALDTFTINAAANFTALPLTSLFNGTDNAFGVYDYGFNGSNAYFTGAGASANAVYGVRLSAINGYPSLSINGGFASSTSTQADNAAMTFGWAIVQFDGASTYTVLDAGSFTATAISGTTTLSGTTGFNPTTITLAGAGAWVGLFVQGSNPVNTTSGQHFNAAVSLSFSAIPEPSAGASVLGASAVLTAFVVRWRRKN